MLRTASLSLACLALSSCTVIADLDSYKVDRGCDLRMDLTDFAAHFTGPHRMEFFVVPTAEALADAGADVATLSSILVLDPTPAIDFTVRMPNAVPNRAHEIQFYADQNNNGLVETLVNDVRIDHTWVVNDVCRRDPIPFEHTLIFQGFTRPAGIGQNLVVNVSNLPEAGGAFELRAIVAVPIDPARPTETVERTFGVYHRPTRDAGLAGDMDPFTATIPGIVDGGVTYILEIWADGDDDGAFDRDTDGTFDGTDDRHYRIEVGGNALLTPFELDFSNGTLAGQTDHSGVVVVTPQ